MSLSDILSGALLFAVPASVLIYFSVSLVLFIISTVRRKKGASEGLAGHRTALKVHLIISSVLLAVTVAVAAVMTVMLYIAIAHM